MNKTICEREMVELIIDDALQVYDDSLLRYNETVNKEDKSFYLNLLKESLDLIERCIALYPENQIKLKSSKIEQ